MAVRTSSDTPSDSPISCKLSPALVRACRILTPIILLRKVVSAVAVISGILLPPEIFLLNYNIKSSFRHNVERFFIVGRK
jgi:hypothetical protein